MDAGCFDNPKNEFREMGKKIFQPSFATGMKFLLLIFVPFVSKLVKFRFLPEDIAIWLSKVLQNNISERKEKPLPQEDLFQWLINGVESDKMDDHTAINHAFSFFIEGFETSSNVMSFALYALAKNTDIQQRLREEVKEVLEQHDGQFTFDALQGMVYLDSVIQGNSIIPSRLSRINFLRNSFVFLHRNPSFVSTGRYDGEEMHQRIRIATPCWANHPIYLSSGNDDHDSSSRNSHVRRVFEYRKNSNLTMLSHQGPRIIPRARSIRPPSVLRGRAKESPQGSLFAFRRRTKDVPGKQVCTHPNQTGRGAPGQGLQHYIGRLSEGRLHRSCSADVSVEGELGAQVPSTLIRLIRPSLTVKQDLSHYKYCIFNDLRSFLSVIDVVGGLLEILVE